MPKISVLRKDIFCTQKNIGLWHERFALSVEKFQDGRFYKGLIFQVLSRK
jgi:hypothetical protein